MTSNPMKLDTEQLLAFWIYLTGYNYMLLTISPIATMIFYIVNICIMVIAIYINRYFSYRFICFIISYCIIALLNVLAVEYSYYAFIESFSALIIFTPCIYIVNSINFSIKKFISYWHKITYINLLMVAICVYLQMYGLLNYGAYTYICLPNIMILSYVYFCENNKRSLDFVNILINLCVIIMLGGRMAAFASFMAIVIGFYLSKYVTVKRKILVGIIILLFGGMIYNFFYQLLECATDFMHLYGIKSRNVFLLSQQFNSANGDLYLTGREYIYNIAGSYIIDRFGMPGGFGVILNLTNGHVYHPHNLILQLSILLGIYGAAITLIVIALKTYMIRKMNYRDLVYFLTVEYFIISISGASFLIHYASLLVIAFLFFYKNDRNFA